MICLALLASFSACAEERSDYLAIVVNSASPLENVTSAELAQIFKSQKTRDSAGARYVVGMRETGCAERAAALKGIYQMSDSEYEKYFLQATFAGTVQAPPKVFAGAGAVKQFVASAPGAISYLRASDADSSVKVLKVDGKAPGDAGYPIKIQ
ncbi:MAG: hypothetical protein C5B50_27535 [Verrucomicrobia bacterium]|nr:MAG: hypothetical protein C5B50_27535 [Verrucomicrobiota bacterium]